jgi:hypothetical protein
VLAKETPEGKNRLPQHEHLSISPGFINDFMIEQMRKAFTAWANRRFQTYGLECARSDLDLMHGITEKEKWSWEEIRDFMKTGRRK